jgi:hypothetical protein
MLEAALGLGLLVPALRRMSLVLILAMHAGLLLCLGPLGHKWNTVVWPWNLAMMAAAVILFWRTPNVSFRAIVRPGDSAYRWAVVVLFGIMPAFNFVGLWDSYLSASLYSGNLIDGDILISPTVYERLPEAVKRHCRGRADGRYEVDLFDWPYEELNVPPYQEPRLFRRVARSFCALAEHPADVVLVLKGRPHLLTGDREERQEDAAVLSGGRHSGAPTGGPVQSEAVAPPLQDRRE